MILKEEQESANNWQGQGGVKHFRLEAKASPSKTGEKFRAKIKETFEVMCESTENNDVLEAECQRQAGKSPSRDFSIRAPFLFTGMT